MRNVYTVKQVNLYIKNMFAQDFMLNRIYVKGEVSNCKYHTSGHIYFSLKDESGTIACIMFAGQRNGLGFRMQDGQSVIVLGSVTTYERDGKYQLYAKQIILDGAGLLYEKFEALKKELGEMGMFAAEYKQPIPKYAKRIGIVTAPTGAAIRDIMNISARRNPYVQLILYPSFVQGEWAAESIVKGIEMLEKQNVDLIIVGRGGGSIEDLWCFNDETVVRTIFNCKKPVISAVGHETDFTLSDFVADLRAPTPSAAAELAVFDYYDTLIDLDNAQNRLVRLIESKLIEKNAKIQECASLFEDPMHIIDNYKNKLSFLTEKLCDNILLDNKENQLNTLSGKLDALSPLKVLSRGYSVVSKDGEIVKESKHVKKGDMLLIKLHKGEIEAEVKSK